MTKLESALVGFLRIEEKKVPALAIVENEKLIGSDLRGLTVDLLMKMASPVLQFYRNDCIRFVSKQFCFC